MHTKRAPGAGAMVVLGLVLELLAGCSPPRHAAGSAPPNVPATRDAIAAARSTVAVMSDSDRVPAAHRFHARTVAEDEATRIFRAMHPHLVACYAKRLVSHPNARAYLVIDVLVGADGRPRDVSTSGGALLGTDTVECVTRHVRTATFAPPENGGTSRVRIPFTFRPEGDDE